jgi:ElaB/YqjD/DUF883 family membrane-anchored ribosome-binding protein
MNSGETTFKQDLEGLAHQAGVIKTDVGVLAHGAAGAVRDGVSELRDGAGHAVDAAKESLAKAEESVKKHVADMETQAASMMKSLRGQVSAHPLAIVGIAVGVGIIAGVLLGRSRA